MKAAFYRKYGGPDCVSLENCSVPIPKNNQILIRIHCTTVNRTDTGFRSAEYVVSRFWSGLFRPILRVLGCEFSGVVEQVGKEVTNFKAGDRVFGYDDGRFGSHAQYLAIDAGKAIAIIPPSISFEQAAPITEGAHYALNNIRTAKLKAGQTALVYGATGAIGSAAVQIMKHLGVEVVAVCSTPHLALVKSLGADTVIDYLQEDFTKISKKFDFVFDAVGKTTFGACKPLLKEKGIYVSTELGKYGQNIWYALITPIFRGKKVIFPMPVMNQEQIEYLRNLVTIGAFLPVIDRYYPLDEIAEAHRYVDTGEKLGNVLIKVV